MTSLLLFLLNKACKEEKREEPAALEPSIPAKSLTSVFIFTVLSRFTP